jgi:hypothetical protein
MSATRPSSSTTTSTMPSSSPSSDPTNPTTNAMKARIITHMNADHASSLSLFARHYCKLPARQSSTAKLTDIELTHLIISTSSPFNNYATNRTTARNYIALTPPMSSFSEARERMVAMQNEALAGLGLSDITVTYYQPPQSPLHIFVFAIALWSWISFCHRPNLLPTAPVRQIYTFWSFGGYWPALASFAHLVQPLTITAMLIIHISEAIYLARTRLRKHQLQTGSVVWGSWVLSNLIEGVGAFQRFDAIVRDKEEEKKRKKH